MSHIQVPLWKSILIDWGILFSFGLWRPSEKTIYGNPKIYRISWYDEDEFGPTYGIYFIVKERNQEQAISMAIIEAKNLYGKNDPYKEYSMFKCEELKSDSMVISSYHSSTII